jgi:conjugative relaxase-like TrwC/TraI family protein
MLSIGTVSAGNQAQREYHERQLAQSRDDYYRETEGPAGVWVGAQAEALGLSGEVDIEGFRRMLDGQDPATGEDLGGRMDRRKTVAFDLAFSAPKSVSLLRMAADDETSETVDRAHERAVLAALSYIEEEGWKGRARVTREDGSRERITVEGTGTMGVLYRHETTRNADPQLHSHAVLANVVRPGRGEPQAINSPVLYQQAKTAGSVYQAVLRGELGRELGLQFETPVNGLADIKGFDRGLIETFSTRRAEILKGLARAGFSAGGAAAERVALESRRAKDMQLDHGLWRVEVRKALERVGLSQDQVRALVRTPAERELALTGAGAGAGTGADEAVRPRSVEERLQAAPLNAVTAERSTEDARAIRQAAMSVAEGFTAEEVGEALGRVFDDARLTQVVGGERPRWTTERHLQLERRVADATLGRMAETTAPRVAAAGYEAPTTTPDGHALSSEQRRVLDQVLTSGHGVEVIRARAGAGKTTIAGLARAEFEAHGIKVVGVAPTLQALAELDDVGLGQRDSLARTALGDGEFSTVMRTMDHRTVVLVDEAGMAQTKEIAPLLARAAERGAKVVAIGDDVQLQAVGAGGWFRYLAEHQDAPVLQLTEVHRQRDDVERDRLNQLHRGDVSGWTRWADQHDRIDVQPTVESAYTAAVSRYEQALEAVGGDVDRLVVMAPENTHRRELNEQLRRVIVNRGGIARGREREYGGMLVAPGDRLVATTTVREEGSARRTIENGERFEVLDVGNDGITARTVAGSRRGKTVRLPRAVLEHSADGRAVEHAYARTVHKAQGMTVDRSILFAPDPARLGRNLAYVGLTRTRDRADLVTVADSRPQGLERLVRGMAERRDHEAAVALENPTVLDPERIQRMSDPEIDEHRHALLTEAREAMTRLTRLDREVRGAWAGSRDARGDAQLLAERDQLQARVDDARRLVAEQDPTGERQDRGLMEHTVRQGIERDQAQLQRLEDRLAGRDVVNVDQADENQAQIRKDREPVQRYLEQLLDGLDRVHGMQIDRSTRSIDPLSVPEHERPALALRQAQERAERVRGLTLSAAQQLGTGHPAVVRWLEQHAPTVERVQERPVEREQKREPVPEPEATRKIPPTAYQRQFMQAIREMQAARREFAQLGGKDALTEALLLRTRVNEPTRRLERLDREIAEHERTQPSRLRRSATEAWTARGAELVEDRSRAADDLDAARRNQTAFERQHDGRPLSEVIERLVDSDERVRSTETRAADVEQQLVRLGPAALDEQRLVRVLGRRNDLETDSERRRYDELAGRLAVFDVLRTQRDEPGRWLQTTGSPDRDVAIWRGEHDMSLSRPQQRVVQEHRQELERTRDTGYDLGR